MSRVFLAKAWLSGVALAVGLAGMALEFRWMVWVAAGMLAIVFLLRFAERKSDPAL